MNLAILIGISNYNGTNNLPGCVTDMDLVRTIVDKTGKFNDILVITSDTTSAKIKSKVAAFVTAHQGHEIEELLFYYTGHGDLIGDDFYFIPTDFDDNRPRQTGFPNADLDAMLRSLAPNLIVKIIDACHCGVSYVKEADAIKKAIEPTKAKFKKCYFMFSSRGNQSSFQGAVLSDFTRGIGSAIAQHTEQVIRYKDVADFVADAFASNPDQTPTFVIQADFIEPFCEVTDDLRNYIAGIIDRTEKTSANAGDLVEVINRDAQRYCTKEEMQAALRDAIEYLKQARHPTLDQLFEKIVLEKDLNGIPGKRAIGDWLYENRSSTDYYVSLESGYGQSSAGATIKVYNFTVNAELPFGGIELTWKPKSINLPPLVAYLVPVVSRFAIRWFYVVMFLKEVSWSKWAVVKPDDASWRTIHADIKTDARNAIERINSEIDEIILAHLNDVFLNRQDGS